MWHDGTAMLLGATKYLSETRNFKGKVVLIFQPAEEGYAGAKAMIDDGLLKKYPIDEIYGMHNIPGLDKGIIAVEEGAKLAAADNFVLKLLARAPLLLCPLTQLILYYASSLIQNLQSIVSRNVNPKETLVVTVATLTQEKQIMLFLMMHKLQVL